MPARQGRTPAALQKSVIKIEKGGGAMMCRLAIFFRVCKDIGSKYKNTHNKIKALQPNK
jgi:hypothetical protein